MANNNDTPIRTATDVILISETKPFVKETLVFVTNIGEIVWSFTLGIITGVNV